LQPRSVDGAEAVALPALVKKPVWRRVREVLADVTERASADLTQAFPEESEVGLVDLGAWLVGVYPGTPKDFVGHPVAYTREASLQKESGFDGEFWMPSEKRFHRRASEFR